MARHAVASGIDLTTRVKQCIKTPPVTIDRLQPIIEAVHPMKDKGVRHLAVTDNGEIIVIISVSNILRHYSGVA